MLYEKMHRQLCLPEKTSCHIPKKLNKEYAGCPDLSVLKYTMRRHLQRYSDMAAPFPDYYIYSPGI